MNTNTATDLPVLPALARLPLKLAPNSLKTIVITRALNTLFATPLTDGELEFLDTRRVNVTISDAELAFCVSLDNDRLVASRLSSQPDLSLEGTVYTFLLLGTRKEDADTLFFRRQLKSQGDTELGLFVKNFLDGLEPETLPLHKILDPLMKNSLAIADRYQRLASRLPGISQN
ncbi:MAG TPA: sterol-binding protein [Gammaproteobacteria bacterium]|nr:sterol-binding protein [Gammaproteobacteria bacterium]